MAYATIEDIEKRIGRTLTGSELEITESLLDESAVIIDAYNAKASAEAKEKVTIRMIARAIGNGNTGIPIGATQGSQGGLGYSESWTFGSGGASGEEYLSKLEKKILGCGNRIGSYSPIQELAPKEVEDERDDGLPSA